MVTSGKKKTVGRSLATIVFSVGLAALGLVMGCVTAERREPLRVTLTFDDALFLRRGFTRLRGSIAGVKNPNPHDPKGEKLGQWKPIATFDPLFAPATTYLSDPVISNVIMGENYHTDIEDVLRAMDRAGARAERMSVVSHGISPDAKGISMKTEWLERMLSSANESGVIIRGVR